MSDQSISFGSVCCNCHSCNSCNSCDQHQHKPHEMLGESTLSQDVVIRRRSQESLMEVHKWSLINLNCRHCRNESYHHFDAGNFCDDRNSTCTWNTTKCKRKRKRNRQRRLHQNDRNQWTSLVCITFLLCSIVQPISATMSMSPTLDPSTNVAHSGTSIAPNYKMKLNATSSPTQMFSSSPSPTIYSTIENSTNSTTSSKYRSDKLQSFNGTNSDGAETLSTPPSSSSMSISPSMSPSISTTSLPTNKPQISTSLTQTSFMSSTPPSITSSTFPSASPSVSPTISISPSSSPLVIKLSPTIQPTQSQNLSILIPNVPRTDVPTSNENAQITIPSSNTPTKQKSNAPSTSLSIPPTTLPSQLPTTLISNNPSGEPSIQTEQPTSNSGQLYEYTISVEMNVNGPNEILSTGAVELWEELTTNFLLQKLLANYRPSQQRGGVIDSILLLEVSLDSQFDFLRTRRSGHNDTVKQNVRRRKAQTIQAPVIMKNEPNGVLLLQFTVNLAFRTVDKDSKMNRQIVKSYIEGAFDSDNDRSLYILLMKQQASLSSSPSYQQLAYFNSISIEVTNVDQIYPEIETLTSSSRAAIITGTTVGISVCLIGIVCAYLRWNELWLFRPKDDYYFGGHVPLADQNSSIASRLSSLPSIPTSIIASRISKSSSKNRNNNSSSSSNSQKISPSNHPKTDADGFIEEEKEEERIVNQTSLFATRQKSSKKKTQGSFEYSLSDHGSSSPHDSGNVNFFRQPLHSQTPQSTSALNRIDDEEDYFSNQDQGENFFRASSAPTRSISASSTLKHKNRSKSGSRSYSSASSKLPFDFLSSDEDEVDRATYFFKDGLKIPRNSSSSSSSGIKSGNQNLKPISPPATQITKRSRPVAVVSAGSSKNSSVMSSMGVEEFIMSSPMSGQVSLFSDDDSALEKFGKSEIIELTAPPGVLGLVLDTVHGGIPTVFSVKEDSIIADKVQEGDRLISVNGVDTTELSARNVSKIITRFKDTERTMIFFRQKMNDDSIIQNELSTS